MLDSKPPFFPPALVVPPPRLPPASGRFGGVPGPGAVAAAPGGPAAGERAAGGLCGAGGQRRRAAGDGLLRGAARTAAFVGEGQGLSETRCAWSGGIPFLLSFLFGVLCFGEGGGVFLFFFWGREGGTSTTCRDVSVFLFLL